MGYYGVGVVEERAGRNTDKIFFAMVVPVEVERVFGVSKTLCFARIYIRDSFVSLFTGYLWLHLLLLFFATRGLSIAMRAVIVNANRMDAIRIPLQTIASFKLPRSKDKNTLTFCILLIDFVERMKWTLYYYYFLIAWWWLGASSICRAFSPQSSLFLRTPPRTLSPKRPISWVISTTKTSTTAALYATVENEDAVATPKPSSTKTSKSQDILGEAIPYSELTVGVFKETFPGENRVSQTPDSVANLIKEGFTVVVQAGGTLTTRTS
jgi:hypothetical protein